MVEALARHVELVQSLAGLVVEPAQEREGRRVWLFAGLDDKGVGEGRLAGLCEEVQEPREELVQRGTIVLNKAVCVIVSLPGAPSPGMLSCVLTLKAVISSNLVHHFLVRLVLQAVTAVRMEQVVCDAITGV